MSEIKCPDELKFLLYEPPINSLLVEFIEGDGRFEPAICISRKKLKWGQDFYKERNWRSS